MQTLQAGRADVSHGRKNESEKGRNRPPKSMLSPKISLFLILTSLLALYHRSVTTTITSLTLNPTIKTHIATSVLDSSDAARKKSEARKKFEGAWETIRSELLTHFDRKNMPIEAREWYKRVSLIGQFVRLC
jgi:hypothetical protein